MDFALAWNATVTEDLHLDPDGTMARFDGSAGRVFSGEPYRAWIKAWRVVDGERQPLPVTVRRATVSVTSGPTVGEAFDVRFRDDGQDGDPTAGDGVVTTRFVPSEKAELARATMARIDAYVEIDGTPRHLVRDFVFAPRDVIEIVGARDQLRDGGLVVTFTCEVLEDGVYTFYGNLVGADDTPIAMTKLSYRLQAGRRTAELVFFGKVIRDRGVDGPYRVKDVHGLKRAEGDEHDVWWRHPAAIDTQPYGASEFSDAGWDDAERRERLANFERVIREMETQGPPPR
jgi:hypothetical protein